MVGCHWEISIHFFSRFITIDSSKKCNNCSLNSELQSLHVNVKGTEIVFYLTKLYLFRAFRSGSRRWRQSIFQFTINTIIVIGFAVLLTLRTLLGWSKRWSVSDQSIKQIRNWNPPKKQDEPHQHSYTLYDLRYISFDVNV